MIISLNSLKGGAGKSSIACNLAVQLANDGATVGLIDCDNRNKISSKFIKRRPEDRPQIYSATAFDSGNLERTIHINESQVDFLIIDGTPTADKFNSFIMSKSDLCLFPIRPSAYDIESFNEEFYPIVRQLQEQRPQMKCYFLPNAFRKKTLSSRAALRFLEDFEIPVTKTVLHSYVIYETAAIDGIGVSESDHIDARFEMLKLAKEIKQILTTKTD